MLTTHILNLVLKRMTGAIPPVIHMNSPYTVNTLTLTPTEPRDDILDSLKEQEERSSVFVDVTRCVLVVTGVWTTGPFKMGSRGCPETSG